MSANIVRINPYPEFVSPYYRKFFSSDWNNRKVEWVKNDQVFQVYLSQCTKEELAAREVQVNVMIARDPNVGPDELGKAENEKWAFVKVKFPKPSSPKPQPKHAHKAQQEEEVECAPKTQTSSTFI